MNPDANSSEFALLSAAQWIASLLVGRIGTAIAAIAIAWLGIRMLQGRLALREGVRIVLGCFILFGAPLIAAGLMRTTDGRAVENINPPRSITASPPPSVKPNMPSAFDPYAGAPAPN